ncbi:piggyBac transposable element-derived protein 4-like [Melanaphis sacchari]|uniref:piggyBac transposable element-derived protein 4-like n=2 Tax=Melanaphis sacchari TaxID=742174 RepID=UPI000DC15970|nr:piggyBac transposable element-derived protein 4-like [Melanaphis sacchari]
MDTLLKNVDEITAELYRQLDEDDMSDADDSSSETEDRVLENDNVVADDFQLSSDEEYDEEIEADREFFLGKDQETIWSSQPLSSKYSRTPSRNLVIRLPGPKGDAKGELIEVNCFSLFLTNYMVEKIVQYTNEEISIRSQNYATKQYYLGPTNVIEIRAIIGLYLKAGIYHGISMADSFSVENGPPLFRAVMSFNRFKFLTYCLRFDSKLTRNERRVVDKFAAFREMWDLFTIQCKNNYTPSEYVTVDETLLSFRGRCPFKMYLPAKPDKYGLKIISICDAKTFYFYGGIPYIGKETRNRNDLLIPTQYVLNLVEPIMGTNRNVTTDNWFTSIELAEQLRVKKLTLVGTLRKNKREVPPHMLVVKNLPPMTTRFLHAPEMTLLSFSKTKNKNVLVLSTMHETETINEISKKPEQIEFYNKTKGGVDVFDKLCHQYSSTRKTNRWPLRYFYGLLDAAAVNGYVIFKHNNLNQDKRFIRSKFITTLAFQLLEPQLKVRQECPFLPKDLKETIEKILKIQPIESAAPSGVNRHHGRCEFCRKMSVDRKGTSNCTKCHRSLCAQHRLSICSTCDIKYQLLEEEIMME